VYIVLNIKVVISLVFKFVNTARSAPAPRAPRA